MTECLPLISALENRVSDMTGRIDRRLDAHEDRLDDVEERLDLHGNIFSHGFHINPGSELRDAGSYRDQQVVNTALLSDIRQAVRWGVAGVGSLIVIGVLALILLNGPSVIGATGGLGGMK